MKIFLTIFSICILTGCIKPKDYVSIKGTIQGNIPDKVFYSLPIEGVCNRNFVESTTPDSLGNFYIEINSTHPSFVKIFTARNAFYTLIAEPGKQYKIELEISPDGKTYFTNRSTTPLQKYYDGLPQDDMMDCRFFSAEAIGNYREILDSLNCALTNELNNFDQLKGNLHISKGEYELIQYDRKIYYATMMSRLLSACNLDFISKENESSQEIIQQWGEVVSKVELTSRYALQAFYVYDLLDFSIWCKMYQTHTLAEVVQLRTKYRQEGLIHTHTISLAKEYLPKETQEFYIASYISLQSRQTRNQHEKEFVEIFDQYTLDYPNSPYVNKFLKNIEKIKEQI